MHGFKPYVDFNHSWSFNFAWYPRKITRVCAVVTGWHCICSQVVFTRLKALNILLKSIEEMKQADVVRTINSSRLNFIDQHLYYYLWGVSKKSILCMLVKMLKSVDDPKDSYMLCCDCLTVHDQ